MSHSHDHGSHSHHHAHNANRKALFISFGLIFTFMVVEFIGGMLTNSLALLSDAGHMLSDAAALGLSLFALTFGKKAANARKTYGYKRFEILAAFINGIALLAISFYIFWEAYHRFFSPPEVASAGMLGIAAIGLLINIAAAWMLMKGDTSGNLNLRSAFLHVLGDLLGSVGAIIAGLLMLFFNWNIADPIASVIAALLVLGSGWRVTKDSVHVLMEGKPEHIDIERLKNGLLSIPSVKDIHDLHIWSITSDFPSLSCHVVVSEDGDRDRILHQVSDYLKKEFKLEHVTLQIEGENHSHYHPCN
ncbi:zinc transporter ZitB [Bacillus glycinifermentans]|uniref:cation diffusion facilitator family transporter n=1 Tax=Bacillus glycinifermentans TaxID=1664069 RepID=UPI000653F518|nr:cation diffusion facilitator family transporter [Bacillus glycinifermentans]KMM56790.1 zinc transporter ZitB [Bacillus glycinifermentans]MEC0495649.1 cation diffusion facilitator family transporter [Bacillus glycinifermentans]MEC0542126.1 cation diffusion facilitator family transporter [Bacillus glycinifermentans]MEC3607531.1 cation diffusion facilitator family transporter [Bacillus glycinifermentans]UOY90616.1 cation diffusion facilitator family transporter [Bacillus glycinifermentans]